MADGGRRTAKEGKSAAPHNEAESTSGLADRQVLHRPPSAVRRSPSAPALELRDSCLEPLDIIAHFVYVGDEFIRLCPTRNVSTFFLEELGDILRKRRGGPLSKP